ncbi:predicted protein [Sclerotinia sclerotiorum 1980 UF-70]|uniref:Uncharacterized protein n=1 Tax=Sclerotinia sclerotiorum (strain ATCC 18683 / 1980 / Ss-1) TaxID=665079 RepID=A7EYD2_SCLS1|nr:predicted protein [Sclerotinia sclerotiorum 1980 UF-70]EDN94474.1 predicted protein [Sclerotinia sclerotiorum 1980 UF-70]
MDLAGPKNIGDVIGTLLSAKKIYLQHPEMARLEKNLRRVEVVVKIMTPLMQHQAEALDFIAQREFGPIPDEYSLWTTQTYETQTCIMQTSKEAKDFLDCSLRNFGPSRKPQTQSYFQIDACYSTDTLLNQ